MEDDDEICLCFHVTKRTLRKFIRLERPRRESQLSGCYGAGTGCGWCRPYLKLIFQQCSEGKIGDEIKIDPEEYARKRADYRKKS